MKRREKNMHLLIGFVNLIITIPIFAQQPFLLNYYSEKYSQEYYSKLLKGDCEKWHYWKSYELTDEDSVRILTIEYNNGDFPEITTFKNLEVLFVKGEFDSIPSKVFSNNNIRELDIISYKSIKLSSESINQEIASLTHLIELEFNNIQFDKFPDVVWSIKTLETLRLQNCRVNSFANSNSEWTNIKKIIIDQCIINKAEFNTFPNLIALSVTNTKLPDIDPLIINHPYLEFLVISNTRIKHKTLEIISGFSHLECLKLFNVKLKKLPEIGRAHV